jgi:phospholipid/cholesterol/gamma-HCH transport system ATP-binding protein
MGDKVSGENTAVLEFQNVTTEPEPFYDARIWGVSFTLASGDLILIRLERGHFRLPIGDVAGGILAPNQGVVRFLGEDWSEMSPDHTAAQRGKIGRVFESKAWISDLDADENIMLAQRHHSKRPDEDIEEEAAKLADLFGLPGLPRGPVSRMHQQDLNLAVFVRAFIGNPVLIILERPTRNLFPGIMPPLINAVRAARERGSAVLWTTSEPRVWNDAGIHPTLKCTMFGSRMNVVAEET